MFIRHKSLDWTAITTFLFVLALAFQVNTLYYFFWLEAFANAFTSTASFTSLAMISGVEASLTVLVTVFYFVSRLTHIQIFLVAMLEVFAFALNWGICRWGVNALTGGGGMTIWMFGILYAIGIKKFYFLEAKNAENARYFTKTFQLIGIVVMVITWPSFNQLMAAHDTAVSNISSTAILQQEAYLQTWLALLSAVIASLSLRILGEKMVLDRFAFSIINVSVALSRLGSSSVLRPVSSSTPSPPSSWACWVPSCSSSTTATSRVSRIRATPSTPCSCRSCQGSSAPSSALGETGGPRH